MPDHELLARLEADLKRGLDEIVRDFSRDLDAIVRDFTSGEGSTRRPATNPSPSRNQEQSDA